jgi:type II secretory pathway pseudopilin PulG
MKRRDAGWTLMELLVVLFPMSLVAAGAVGFFSTHNRIHVQQDLSVALEENLRAAMGMVTDTLRTAGCGVPKSNLADWIPWVSGFDNDSLIFTDGGSNPDTVSIAACAPEPIATLTARADIGATSLSLSSNYSGSTIAELLNTSDKRLIWIGDTQHALVRSIAGGTVGIDTDPTTNGNQGLARAYLPGTPVSRIDVLTFQVQTDSVTGVPWLRLNKHRGTQDPAAEGISDLQLTAVVPGEHYQVTLTARSEAPDPISGEYITRTLSSDVSLRN